MSRPTLSAGSPDGSEALDACEDSSDELGTPTGISRPRFGASPRETQGAPLASDVTLLSERLGLLHREVRMVQRRLDALLELLGRDGEDALESVRSMLSSGADESHTDK